MNQTEKRSVSWGGRTAAGMILALLILPLLALGPAAVAEAKAQPALMEMAAAQPDQPVRIIAQMAEADADGAALIAALGGTVIKDLHIINAYAAEMNASEARMLASSPAVRWVSLDGPVASAGKPTNSSGNVSLQTLRDDFNIGAFDNNNGSQIWASAWTENDPFGAGPGAGSVKVSSGRLSLGGMATQGEYPSVERKADLGHALGQVILYFGFSTGPGVVPDLDSYVLEVSKDDGQSYSPVVTFRGYDPGINGTFYGTIEQFISPYTRIRLRVVSGYDRPDAHISFDWVEVRYDANPLSSGWAFNTYLETLGVPQVWDMGYDGSGIGVVIVDSGVNKESDFGRRIKKAMSFSPTSTNVNDMFGHGTHVAGIAGGDGAVGEGRFAGVAPGIDLYSLKINDATGLAFESDMVDALQWVLDYKDRYNLRVVNLSLNSTMEGSYHNSPINAAVEILWFNGVVVVASAGNSGEDPNFDAIDSAPANDPFIITVGASHENWTADRSDDKVATFSASGTTSDGFAKPEIVAPGKDIVSLLSSASPWYGAFTERSVHEKYFRLSGTSMSAPMVTGAVALMLQADPSLTPDQVKYRLMDSATVIPGDVGDVNSYRYLDVYGAVTSTATASANTGIQASQLLWTGSDPVAWDSVSWNSVSWNSVSWNSVSWNSVSWNSVSWNSVSWNN